MKTFVLSTLLILYSVVTQAATSDSVTEATTVSNQQYQLMREVPELGTNQYYTVSEIVTRTVYNTQGVTTECYLTFTIIDSEFVPLDLYGDPLILLDDKMTFLPYEKLVQEITSQLVKGICDLRK